MGLTFGDVPESSVSVLIADAHANRRRAIRRALIAGPTLDVVGEAVDFDHLLVELETRQPSVLVVSDDLLQERAGSAHLYHVCVQALASAVRTLLLTESLSAESPRPPLRDHLWGCLSYSRVEQDLLKAVGAIASGEMWFSRRQLSEMFRERVQISAEQVILQGLTAREIEVVQLIARGRTNKEIAQAMNISDLTVKTHVQNIFKKCGLRRRGELPRQMVAA